MTSEYGTPNNSDLEQPLREAVERVNRHVVSSESIGRVTDRAHELEGGRPSHRATPWRPVLTRLAAGLVAAAALIAAVLLSWNSTPRAWAQVVDAVKAQRWIHMKGTMHDGTPLESWLSSPYGIHTAQQGERVAFIDWKQNVQETYKFFDAKDDAVYRTPLVTKMSVARFEKMAEGLLSGDFSGIAAPGEDGRIANHEVTKVEREGKTWHQHRLAVTSAKPNLRRTVTLLVDPQDGLPKRIDVTVTGSGGSVFGWEATLDYPKSGPMTIYALGVPQSAKVVDRIPKGDLKRLLAGVETSRRRFDAYRAISISTSNDDPRAYNTGALLRIYRRGRKWRVETCRPPRENFSLLKPPADADPHQWWQQEAERGKNWVRDISDGATECTYIAVHAEPRHEDPQNPGYMKIEKFKENCHSLLDGMLPREWDRFPDFQGYPNMYDSTRIGWETTVDPNPTSGPRGAVLVECRRLGKASPRQKSIHRYWIDPAQSYLVTGQEFIYGDPDNPSKTSAIEVIEVGRTPSGLAYPKLIRFPGASVSLETGKRSDDFYRFFVDFDVPVSDDLFVIEP